jgi:hypothetical protein
MRKSCSPTKALPLVSGTIMSEQSRPVTNLPPEQQAIRAKCFHPTGTFVEFRKEDIEQSIPERFEKIVRMHANRVAIKTDHQSFTYADQHSG